MACSLASPTPSDDCPQTDLLNALSALHVGGKYSDLTITCNYRQWAVHRAIVCSRSGFFDGACSNPFREAHDRTIDMSDDDEDAVDQMIHFFYYLDYGHEPEQPRATDFRHRTLSDARRKLPKKLDLSHIQDPLLEAAGYYTATSPVSPTGSASFDLSGKTAPASPTTKARMPTPPFSDAGSDTDWSDADEREEEVVVADDPSHLLLHTRVYALAEKCDVPALKALAKRKFEVAVACHYDSPDLPDAIEEVYCSTLDTDRGLRDVVLRLFYTHPQLATTPDIRALIQQLPTLALELFKIERGIPVAEVGR